MVLGRIRGFSRDESYESDDDYVEVGAMDTGMGPTISKGIPAGKLGVKIDKLGEFNDTERILRHIREGKIVFLKIKELKDKDMGELKRSIERLRKTVVAGNGDIAGVEQDWLIITPESIVVHRD